MKTQEYKVGDCFYCKAGYEYHIIGIPLFQSEDDKLIIYKYFGKHKQWWHYEIKTVRHFESWLDCGLYKLATKEEIEEE